MITLTHFRDSGIHVAFLQIGVIWVTQSSSFNRAIKYMWIRSTVSIIVNREHHPIPNELLCTHVEAVQKQLEIFLFTCLQNLLVFSNQVQIKFNIRLVQKTISKISFKGDKIGWNLEQKIPQQQVFHLACLYAHNAFGLATPYDLSFTVKSIEVSAFIEGGTYIRWMPLWTCKIDPFSSFCSFDTLNDAGNTSPICEKQPLSHVFLNKYVIHLGSPPWCYSHLMPVTSHL